MTRTLLFMLLIIPAIIFAENSEIFSVQIGSYRHFADDVKKDVSQYGVVHVFTFNNLSRVTVGEFTDRSAAEALKRKLRMTGYKDAFVRKTGYADLDKTRSDIEKFNILISELDAQAFYLNGHMYLFQGQGYIRIHRHLP